MPDASSVASDKPGPWDLVVRLFSGHDAFISYSRRDSHYGFQLALKLADLGLTPFIDQLAALPGDQIPLEVKRALFRSRLLVVVVTESSVASKNVALEIQTFSRTRGTLLYLAIEGIPLPATWPRTAKSKVIREEAKALQIGRPSDAVARAIGGAVSRPGSSWRERLLLLCAGLLVALAGIGMNASRAAEAAAKAQMLGATEDRDDAQARLRAAAKLNQEANAAASSAKAAATEATEQAKQTEALVKQRSQAMVHIAEALRLDKADAPQLNPEPSTPTEKYVDVCFAGGVATKIQPKPELVNSLELAFFVNKNYLKSTEKKPFELFHQNPRPGRGIVGLLFRDRVLFQEISLLGSALPPCRR